MKRIADFLVDKRIPLLAVMLAAVLVCAFLAAGLRIERDMTKYLPESSNMRQGLDVMSQAFPDAESASIRVMFDGLDEEDIAAVRETLARIPNVRDVVCQPDSQDYRRDGRTLFVVSTDFGYGSDEEQAIEDAIGRSFPGYDMVYRSDEAQPTKVTPQLLAAAVAMALAILIVMSRSWLEPVLFVATIGAAIVINLGTNVIFPYISEMTASIGPIIQLVLSMDYSIILMDRYRQEKAACPDKLQAMKTALHGAFASIASSAMTTVVGLLALVLLSFRMGPELAIVLAKGVFISMLCVFTILPVLILVCDRAIERSRKPAPRIPTGLAAAFSYRARFFMPLLFAGLLVGACILQRGTGITFTEGAADPIAAVFPKENTVVLVYDDQDEEHIPDILAALEDDGHIRSVTGYANTLGRRYTAPAMAQALAEMDGGAALDESAVRLLYYDYFGGGQTPVLTAGELADFLQNDVLADESLASRWDGDMAQSLALLGRFSDAGTLTAPMTAAEMAAFLGMDEPAIQTLYMLYLRMAGAGAEQTATPQQFIAFLVDSILPNQAFAAAIDQQTAWQLQAGRVWIDAVVGGETYDVSGMTALLGSLSEEIGQEQVGLLYLYYGALRLGDESQELTIPQLLDFLCGDVLADERFASFFDPQAAQALADGRDALDEAAQLKNAGVGRLILTTDYPEESAATTAFLEKLDSLRQTHLRQPSYLVGASAMVYEMDASFAGEYRTISLVTAAAIFLVVLLTFRGLVVPALLTLLVQCGVYITVAVIGLFGGSMYYLALLIVQSILMGATIDYGIVFSSYYRQARRSMERPAALRAAYDGSIHTIMTSGSILVLVLAVLGLFASSFVAQVCKTLSVGSLVAIVLILLVLPALLACFDRFVAKKRAP